MLGLVLNKSLANWFNEIHSLIGDKGREKWEDSIEKLQITLMIQHMIYWVEMPELLGLTLAQSHMLVQISQDPLLHYAFWMCIFNNTDKTQLLDICLLFHGPLLLKNILDFSDLFIVYYKCMMFAKGYVDPSKMPYKFKATQATLIND